MDVDGVLTDGTVCLDESGRESKRLHFADIMGIADAKVYWTVNGGRKHEDGIASLTLIDGIKELAI